MNKDIGKLGVAAAGALALIMACTSGKGDQARPGYNKDWDTRICTAGDCKAICASVNPTGNPIGGGEGYSDIYLDGDYRVANLDELSVALQSARSGEVIYVTNDIDLTPINTFFSDYWLFNVPDGVTLAGNRGHNGSQGPVIFSHDMHDHKGVFQLGSRSRVTGLRLKGPDQDVANIDYAIDPKSNASGLGSKTGASDIVIDNCEIANFHWSGITVGRESSNMHVHHNHFHDIHAYPVVIGPDANETALVEANIIEWIWHSIASGGGLGTGYTFAYNVTIRKAIPQSWHRDRANPALGYHGIDVHSTDLFWSGEFGQGNAYDYVPAGDSAHVHHNTMIADADDDPSLPLMQDLKLRGVPRRLAEVHDNCFFNQDANQAVMQSITRDEQAYPMHQRYGNFWAYDNYYGPDHTPIAIDPKTSAQILFHTPVDISDGVAVYPAPMNLDLTINLLPTLTLKRVKITLNNSLTLYDGATAPDANAVSISCSDIDPALPHQTLKVEVIDSRPNAVTARNVTLFILDC